MRLNITIFSNSFRKIILIEVACSCEGNIESGRGTKLASAKL